MQTIEQIRERSKNKLAFHGQILTDGVSASIVFQTPIKKYVDNAARLQRIREKDKKKDYHYEIGVDIGYNTYIAATRLTCSSKNERNITLKSKAYHRSSKNNCRNKHFDRLVGNYEKEADAHRHSIGIMPTPCGPNVWTYIDHKLLFWTRGINLYTTASYAKMAFDKHSQCQGSIDRIVNYLTNRKSSLFFIGGAEFSPNSPIKGHVRCPGIRKLIKALKKHEDCDYVFVDEHNTSRHCGKCIRRFDDSTKNNRFKQCIKCPGSTELHVPPQIKSKMAGRYKQRMRKKNLLKPLPKFKIFPQDLNSRNIIWHRDITAARLIWYKGITTT